ncbi:gamma-aminobutyrate permease, partial [Burkholderia multivorans]
LFGFLTEVMGDGAAYTWLINVSGLSGFIVWIGIAWCHFRFRRAYVHQGHDVENLPYRAPLFPIGPIIALVMLIVVVAGQNIEAVADGRVLEVASAYIGLPIFLLVWGLHRLITGPR